MGNEIFYQLEETLDNERIAILNGKLDLLPRFAEDKERLRTIHNNASRLELHELELLKTKASRNQRLLGAALSGLRAATSRIQAIKTGQRPLNTYNQSGQKQALSDVAAGSLERRA